MAWLKDEVKGVVVMAQGRYEGPWHISCLEKYISLDEVKQFDNECFTLTGPELKESDVYCSECGELIR